MTTGIEHLKLEKKRQGRGPSRKPTLVNTSLRLPKEVVDYFETFSNKQVKIREVLVNYVQTQTGEFKNGNS